MSGRNRIGRAALALALLFLALGTYQFRRSFIRAVFVPGSGDAPPPRLALPESADLAGRGLGPVERVRAVLIDGVTREDARRLPNYSAVCERGLDLVLDVGFPTVSLPVQHALWTGLTQQQTGVLFFNKLLDPPPESIPARVPGSIAVAESHQKIVHSIGFEHTLPDLERVPEDWSLNATWRAWLAPGRARGFENAALEAMASDARLAFVHILRTDTVAHKRGRLSRDCRTVIEWSDDLLGRLVAAERAAHPSGTRWFVFADHGHRDGGGHGGAEPWIRKTRLCIAGDLPGTDGDGTALGGESARTRTRPDAGSGYIHLVDLSRAIADSLGAKPSPESAGRPLFAAVAAPVDDTATLPSPGRWRWLAAALLLLFAALATGWAAKGRWQSLPWWWPIAYLSVLVIELTPSLSTSMIYKALGRTINMAALPGYCALAILVAISLRKLGPVRVAVAELLLPAAIAGAALVLCGGAHLIAGVAGEPPLMPAWTGHASVFLMLFTAGAIVVAVALLMSAISRQRRREP